MHPERYWSGDKENLVRSVVHLVCESVVYAVIGLVSVTLLMF